MWSNWEPVWRTASLSFSWLKFQRATSLSVLRAGSWDCFGLKWQLFCFLNTAAVARFPELGAFGSWQGSAVNPRPAFPRGGSRKRRVGTRRRAEAKQRRFENTACQSGGFGRIICLSRWGWQTHRFTVCELISIRAAAAITYSFFKNR